MAVFFNGRKWVTPTTMSVVDDSAMANRNLNLGNVLAVLGKSAGGKPFTPLSFGSYDEAAAVLLSGEALMGIKKAFDPSTETFAPSRVVFIRINDETQSSLTLAGAGGGASINLVSTEYGVHTRQIAVKVEDASKRGKKLSTRYGGKVYAGDNVYRRVMSVQYIGAGASATFSCDATTATLSVAGEAVDTIDLAAVPTVQMLVDRINGQTGFIASVLDGNGRQPSLNGLDGKTSVDVKVGTPVVITAIIQACVDWFNSVGEGFVTAVRADGASKLPNNINYTFMSGGSDGLVTMNEWARAYEVLQGEDVQWVVPITDNEAVHAMNDSHCAFMSNVARKERRGIVGTALGTTDEAAQDAALALNSDRTSLVHLGFYDYNEAGKLTLFPPYILAAQLAGMFSGVNPGTALTNKSIKVRGLERKLRNPTDTDDLIEGGVLCVEETGEGYKVVKSITTWLVNDNYNRVEVSTGVACDFTARSLRDAIGALKGRKGSPTLLADVLVRGESVLRQLSVPEPLGPEVLVGDKESPPYKNLTASLEGDVVRFECQASPVIPANYFPIVIYAVPYSGSASA